MIQLLVRYTTSNSFDTFNNKVCSKIDKHISPSKIRRKTFERSQKKLEENQVFNKCEINCSFSFISESFLRRSNFILSMSIAEIEKFLFGRNWCIKSCQYFVSSTSKMHLNCLFIHHTWVPSSTRSLLAPKLKQATKLRKFKSNAKFIISLHISMLFSDWFLILSRFTPRSSEFNWQCRKLRASKSWKHLKLNCSDN